MRSEAPQSFQAYSRRSGTGPVSVDSGPVRGGAGESGVRSPQIRQPVALSMARLMESRSHPTQHLTETTSEPPRPLLSRTPRCGLSRLSWQMPGRGHQPEEECRADGLIRLAMASESMRSGGFMAWVAGGGCAMWCDWSRLCSW